MEGKKDQIASSISCDFLYPASLNSCRREANGRIRGDGETWVAFNGKTSR